MKTTFSSHYVTQDCNNTTWKVSYRGPVFALLDLHNSQRPAIVPKEQHHRVIGDRRDLGKSLRSTFLGDTCSCTLNYPVLQETAAWSPLAPHISASLRSEGKEPAAKEMGYPLHSYFAPWNHRTAETFMHRSSQTLTLLKPSSIRKMWFKVK